MITVACVLVLSEGLRRSGAVDALNVAFGGTLYQDIPTQRPDAIAHVRADH